MDEKCVLIIDDDYSILEVTLKKRLENFGFRVAGTADQKEALRLIKSESPDIILLDVFFPDGQSKGTLKKIKDKYPESPPVIMISNAMLESSYNALDYQSADARHPKELIEKEKQIPEFIKFMNGILSQPTGDTDLGFVVGNTKYMKETVAERIKKVADTDTTVLITGETGTGKEEAARAVHYLSKRKKAPFIVLNCATLPNKLIESELFGYEKGAFSGADRKKLGRVALANEGTLFLDEVGEIPLEYQAKLLRLLREKEYHPLGGTRTEKSDVRFIAATNRNLKEMVQAGTYREDLYYRLNVFPIHLPPLRDRLEDIPLLIVYFMKGNNTFLSDLREDVRKLLVSHKWPGNIGELKNRIEAATILAKNDRVFQTHHFQSIIENSAEEKPLFNSAAEVYESLSNSPLSFPEIARKYGEFIAQEVGKLFLEDKNRWPNEEESQNLFDSKANAVRGWLSGKGITKASVLPKN